MNGWEQADTETLIETRCRLLGGLDLVDGHIHAGTVDEILPGHATPAREAGYITLILLEGLDQELNRRNAL